MYRRVTSIVAALAGTGFCRAKKNGAPTKRTVKP
jgi:hypothetical protein